MKISFSRGIGRKVMAYVLVGSMVTCTTPKVGIVVNDTNRDLINGFYYDEDVKKNREDLMNRIKFGGSEKVKLLGKSDVNNLNVRKI